MALIFCQGLTTLSSRRDTGPLFSVSCVIFHSALIVE
jgi:hypothetical protein